MKTLQLKFGTNKLNKTQLVLVKGGNPIPTEITVQQSGPTTDNDEPGVINPTV